MFKLKKQCKFLHKTLIDKQIGQFCHNWTNRAYSQLNKTAGITAHNNFREF